MIDVAVKSHETLKASVLLRMGAGCCIYAIARVEFFIMLNNQYLLSSLLKVSRGNGYA